MRSFNPPDWIIRFFQWFCHEDYLEGLEGDMYELFDRNALRYGRKVAIFFYFFQILSLLRYSVSRNFFKNSNNNFMGFFINYAKTA